MRLEAKHSEEFISNWHEYYTRTYGKPTPDAQQTSDNHPIPNSKRLDLIGVASKHIRVLLLSIDEKDEAVSTYVGHTLTKIEEELD